MEGSVLELDVNWFGFVWEEGQGAAVMRDGGSLAVVDGVL